MPIPGLGPAIVGGVGRLAGGIIGAGQTARNIAKSNRANLELAKYGYQKDLEMWRMQNEYNSPEAQMRRFEEAGLNKHMIYGQGTPGNATGFPSFNQPNLDYRGTPDPAAEGLGAITGVTKDVLEIANEKSRLDKAAADAWLANETKVDKAELQEQLTQTAKWNQQSAKWKSKIAEIHKQMWDGKINPNDAAWLRLGQEAIRQFDDLAPDWMKEMFDRAVKNLESVGKGVNKVHDTFDDIRDFIKSAVPDWVPYNN